MNVAQRLEYKALIEQGTADKVKLFRLAKEHCVSSRYNGLLEGTHFSFKDGSEFTLNIGATTRQVLPC